MEAAVATAEAVAAAAVAATVAETAQAALPETRPPTIVAAMAHGHGELSRPSWRPASSRAWRMHSTMWRR